MEKVISIEFKHVDSVCHFFVPQTTPLPGLRDSDTDGTATIVLLYDYEKLKGRKWNFFVDVKLALYSLATVCTRTSFEAEATEEQLFSVELLKVPASFAVKECIRAFAEQSQVHQLEAVEMKEEMFEHAVRAFAETSSEEYFTKRKKEDIANREIKAIHAMHISRGNRTILVAAGTFNVLDQVLFYNPAFNHLHNQQTLNKVYPLSRYFTLRLKSLGIMQHDINYNLFDITFFLILTDAALQLLVGEHADHLTDRLQKKSFIAAKVTDYIRYASEMIRDYRKHLESSGAIVTNLNEQYDWNALIE